MAYKASDFVKAINETGCGIKLIIAKKVGCSRHTLDAWIEKSPTVKKAFEASRETSIDFAESKLMSQIKEGNTTAIIFFLKTIGKSRGYIERQEVEVKEPPVVNISLSDDK